MGLACNPPKPGDESYERFLKVSSILCWRKRMYGIGPIIKSCHAASLRSYKQNWVSVNRIDQNITSQANSH